MPRSVTVTVGSVSQAPTSAPVNFSGDGSGNGPDAGLLVGPSSAPVGAVIVTPGGTALNTLTASNPAGTTFYILGGGTCVLSSAGAFTQIQPKPGNTYIGAPGAVLDGQNGNRSAFTRPGSGGAANVTIKTLEIKNFVTLTDQFTINQDAESGWLIEGCNIHDNLGGAINPGSNSHIYRSWIHDNAQYGISSFKAPTGGAGTNAVDSPTVSYCEVSANGTWQDEYATGGSGPLGSGAPTNNGRNGGCKWWDTSNILMDHVWVHHNEHVGIWADTNNVGMVVQDSLIEYNFAEAFFFEISYNPTFRRNLVRGNAVFKGMNFARRSDDFPVAAVYLSESGADSTVGTGPALCYIGGPTAADGNVFVDNWGEITLWESADRFCNSPANTSGKVWKTLGNVSGTYSSLGLCNVPTAKTLTVTLTSGLATFVVTSGTFASTDEGRACSGTGIPVGAKILEPTSTSTPIGYVNATNGVMSAPATASGSVTMTLAAGGISTEPGYSVCRWKTQNMRIQHNTFSCDPAVVQAQYPTVVIPGAIHFGKVALLSQVGTFPSWSPYTGNAITDAMISTRNNLWLDNTYSGTHTFMPHDQGTYKTLAQWQASPYFQDAGSI